MFPIATMLPTRQDEIRRFLQTGDYDLLHAAWPGNIFERGRRADGALLGALIREVRRRSRGKAPPASLPPMDLQSFTRAKVEPMVRGFFPVGERGPVMAVLERSVVFLTPANLERVLRETSPSTAWTLANLYLTSVGAALLGDETEEIVGLSEETTCYVSLAYFASDDPFADYVVHEVAHIFHNSKRRTVGLPESRKREWLLDIEFRKRETFAYACEAYSRILETARTPRERGQLLAKLETRPSLSDDRVEPGEYIDILREAVSARNGWKRILARCARPRPVRRRSNLSSSEPVPPAIRTGEANLR